MMSPNCVLTWPGLCPLPSLPSPCGERLARSLSGTNLALPLPPSLHYLVTRAEMMSVIVLLRSPSISSTGPGIGSCWHTCSARRICCRFCQMISASFSHLRARPS